MIDKILNEINRRFDINLNKQQREYVMHKDGPAITLAVPGAGKTTSLVLRLYVLTKYYKVDPKNILVMTFSRAAAKDMESRFKTLFGENCAVGITFSTIHSFALSVIKNYQRYKGVSFKIIEGDNAPNNKIQILKEIYRQESGEYINDDQLEELCNSIGFVKNSMISKQDLDKYTFSINAFKDIYSTYEKYKESNGYIDFDDMLTLSYDILRNNEVLLNFYRNRYKYILLDEGQDTSPIQHEIVRLISYPNNNLSIIGDDDQTIFGFRGASPEKLIEFKSIYKDAKVYFMEQNYRSTHSIVSIARDFIKINKVRYDKSLFTEREEGSKVSVVNILNEKWQAKYIIDEIKELKDYNSIAVLFRNNISAAILADELDKNGITFYIKDNKIYLFNHWVTIDIIAFMKLALNKNDISSLERIYYKMGAYLPKTAIEYVKSQEMCKSVWDILKECPLLTQRQIERVIELKVDFEYISNMRPREAIQYICDCMNYKEYLKGNGVKSGYSMDSLNNIIDIISLISEDIKDIPLFFERLNELQNKIEYSRFNKGRGVNLSTIHSSKGLEYDTVYMIDLIDGEFPSYTSIVKSEREKDYELMEEETRLFYVGITRAKNNLCLFELENRYGRKAVPSRFLKRVKDMLNPKEALENRNSLETYNTNIGELEPGMSIMHSIFGKGDILSLEGDVLEVNFNERGTKRISLKLCLERRLLSNI